MGQKTALVVDDSKLARITLKKKLEQRQLQVIMAESGIVALEQLQNNQVDLVFMDHLMPEMDGFAATQRIKGTPATAHIPVIMCSGKDEPDFVDQAKAIGADGVLAKPPANEALDALLNTLSPNTDSLDSVLSGNTDQPQEAAKPASASAETIKAAEPASSSPALEQAFDELKASVAALSLQFETQQGEQQSALRDVQQSLQQQVSQLEQAQKSELADLRAQLSATQSESNKTAVEPLDVEALEASLSSKFSAQLQAEVSNLQALPERLNDLQQTVAQLPTSASEPASTEQIVDEIQQALQPALSAMLDQRLASETGHLKQQVDDQVGLQLSYRLEQLKAEQQAERPDMENLRTELEQKLEQKFEQRLAEQNSKSNNNQDVTRELNDLREESIQAVRQAAEQALNKLSSTPSEKEPEQQTDAGGSRELIEAVNQQMEQQKRDVEAKTSGLKFALACSLLLALAGVAGHLFL